MDRVTIVEAARRLGISESGVRKRIKRGQLDHTREDDGRIYVYLDTQDNTGQEQDPVPDSVPDRYVEQLESEVEFLRDQVRRQQEIIGQQAISLRALSAPAQSHTEEDTEPPDSGPDTAPSETSEGATEPRSWLSKILFGWRW